MSPFTTKTLSSKKKIKEEIIETPPSQYSLLKIFLGVFLGCISMLFVGSFVYALIASNQVNTPATGETRTLSETIQGSLTGWFGSGGMSLPKENTYILLTGVGGAGHEGGNLTDTIMLAGINTKKNTISMISIPRDLYVAVGKSSGTRINELYNIGLSEGVGDQLLRDKIEEMTGIKVKYSIMIDFTGFRQAVDILGGIEVDVPEDLIDREFPDNNYGYKVLTINKGIQTFDGETALAYARSRHSTSDFSRSARQQLLIKAIKEKVLSSGIYNPTQILDLFDAVKANLKTDIPLTSMVGLALDIKAIPSDNIMVTNLSNSCLSVKTCEAGGFLYNPSRDLFGGASVLIPENASLSRLSYYDDIKRLSHLFFEYPTLQKQTAQISIITTSKYKNTANILALSMKKLGFSLATKDPIFYTTGAIENSHVNIYWHKEHGLGYDPSSELVQALKTVFETMTFIEVPRNEYITNDGPRIEIVLGADIKDHTAFAEVPYYIPAPAPKPIEPEASPFVAPLSESQIKQKETTTIPKAIVPKKPTQSTIESPIQTQDTEEPIKIEVGEWEDFSTSSGVQ